MKTTLVLVLLLVLCWFWLGFQSWRKRETRTKPGQATLPHFYTHMDMGFNEAADAVAEAEALQSMTF